jgi:Flp pilus assembly protein TadD
VQSHTNFRGVLVIRLAAVLSVVLSFGLLPSVVSGQQVGDKIVVITDDAPLRSNNETMGSVPKGNVLVVKNVNGDWFWVIWSSGETETVKGWISRSDVIPFSQALDFFNEELKRNPTANAYSDRGMIWAEKGEKDIAIADYNEAIRLDPHLTSAYNNRGNAWNAKKEYDKAIADYDEAIRLDPKFALANNNRGIAWRAKKEYDKAICDYNEAIRLDPKYSDPWNNRAMIYAACTDPRFRNGRKAVDDATQACELTRWKNGGWIDTLAAAYAEAGDFDVAVKWQTKARDMVSEKEKADYQSRLDLYKAHKPYRYEVKK